MKNVHFSTTSSCKDHLFSTTCVIQEVRSSIPMNKVSNFYYLKKKLKKCRKHNNQMQEKLQAVILNWKQEMVKMWSFHGKRMWDLTELNYLQYGYNKNFWYLLNLLSCSVLWHQSLFVCQINFSSNFACPNSLTINI